MNTRADVYQERARELAIAAGVDPDSRIDRPGKRSMPAWCAYREAARSEHLAAESIAVNATLEEQEERYQNAPLTVLGDHEQSTIDQMRTCMKVGNTVAGAVCADGHLGYAQPVGGVIAYEKQVSISGVGFDIGCGNLAVQLDTRYQDIRDRSAELLQEIAQKISFGVGRVNDEQVDHELFLDSEAWKVSGMEDYRQKALHQLGSAGSGNHYVDVFYDEEGYVWIGVHFGSRGLGHTTATRYLKAAGGADGINVAPTVLDDSSELGVRYLAGMELAGRYAYAGREWVADRVGQIIGGEVMQSVHNHHNFAFWEKHNGKDLWVVRKGATPAFPGQKGFVGGSMGDDAVILEGVEGDQAKSTLYSTVHGAGRVFGRKEAKRRFTREQMDQWLREREVFVSGGDLDESPMAYRRLPEVLAHHAGTIKVLHTLRPFIVVMAGKDTVDPWKD